MYFTEVQVHSSGKVIKRALKTEDPSLESHGMKYTVMECPRSFKDYFVREILEGEERNPS